MRTHVRPSRVNGADGWTLLVHDSRPLPVGRLSPLAELMNYREVINTSGGKLDENETYCCFSTSSSTHYALSMKSV